MSCQRYKQFHLFNCGNTYSLNVVEKLLEKAKLDFEFSVEKHNFPLCQMAELCTDKIPKIKMDFAIFVVHANESHLSINEDKAGIGYAKVYRALLQATGDKVIIVIGGDDNYKNQDEKDTGVISRWARRKISSQFTEEFLDGRKSFIFSWDKEHRSIHEEAMLHYFDDKKAGQKFDFQPKKQVLTSPVPGEDDSEKPASTSYSCDQEKMRDDVSQNIKTGTSDSGTREELPSSKETPDSALGPGAVVQDLVIFGCNASDDSLSAVYQVIEDLKPKLNLKSDPPKVSRPPGLLKSYLMKSKVKFCLLVVDADAVKSALENSQRRVEYEEVLKTALDQVVEKVIVAICGPPSLPESDETTVTQAINSILQRNNKGFMVCLKGGQLQMGSEGLLGILQSIQETSQSAGDVRGRQEYPVPSSNYSDGEGTQIGLTRAQSTDYPGECDASSVSMVKQSGNPRRATYLGSYRDDEEVIAVVESNKPYDQPSRGGHVMSHELQIAKNVSWPYASNQPQNQLSRDGTVNTLSADCGETTNTRSSNPTGVHGGSFCNPKGEKVTVMMKAHLRNGKISKEDGDLLYPNWTVPHYLQDDFMSKYSDTSEAELEIFYDESGALRSIVTPKGKPMQKVSPQELASNETLMLKSVIRNGKVSLSSEDVEYLCPGWQIPDDIIKRTEQNERETSKADLFIISDELGNLRSVVHTRAVSRVQNFFNKLKAHFK